MKCPLCSAYVTEAELDYNVKETLKGFAGETKAKPHINGSVPDETRYWPLHQRRYNIQD
jgi:hypothetical protein